MFAATALLLSGAASCGRSSSAGYRRPREPASPSHNSSSTAAARYIPERDRDGDEDNQQKAFYDRDDYLGPPAGASDARAITALAHRFYRDGARADGADACSLLYWPVAEDLPEQYASAAATSSGHFGTCAQTFTRLFAGERSRLATAAVTMKVVSVPEEGTTAWIVMTFAAHRERILVLHRDGDSWRIMSPRDRSLP